MFFDIRNDSDASFGLYDIHVAGIEDLQLMELASRNFMYRARQYDSVHREAKMAVGKDNGKHLFNPQQGGSYVVFDHRPLSRDIKEYCVQGVTFMPRLRDIYSRKLCDAWWGKIDMETNARIQFSQSPSCRGKGQHVA
ncbi:hypothetical protein LTR49_026124 [Elasticomyces elasticus]|nr:hypothetical protein LTR49_026124 [Elasticomyces elasticus]